MRLFSAILDLQELLKEHKDLSDNPLDMPRALILQFDNCAENKVNLVKIIITLYIILNRFILSLLTVT